MYYTYYMDQSLHSQKMGNQLRDRKGTEFFSNINPKKKLSSEQVKAMLEKFKAREQSGATVPAIAEEYKVTPSTVYWHAKRNGL